MKALIALIALLAAAPLAAQDMHAGHAMPAPAQDPQAGQAMPEAAPDPHAGHEMTETDAPVSPGPQMETPPPPEAGSGPPRAADAIWGADAMAASRDELRRTHGSFPLFWFQGDRVETQARKGGDTYLWDIQGYYGTPTSRLWFKSEGEGDWGSALRYLKPHVAGPDPPDHFPFRAYDFLKPS